MNTPANDTVQFLIRDIVHPRPAQVLFELFQQNCISGQVMAVTDGGQEPARFLVVYVEGLSEPVIVPTEKVLNPSPLRSAAVGRHEAPQPVVVWEGKSQAPV